MRQPRRLKAHRDDTFALSEEDSRLFREAVGHVVPLAQDKAPPVSQRKKFRRRFHEADWADNPLAGEALLTTADVMSFVAPGLPKKVLQRLRSGKYGVDVELDLHGLTVIESKRRLGAFLQACLADGSRCLHLIHGKGYRSEGDYPILKNRINLWLRQHPDVLAFCTARPVDGGTGAVYVLLRDRHHGRDSLGIDA